MATNTDTVFDQEATPDDVVPITDTVKVYEDQPLGWAYICTDTRCSRNTTQRWHALSGFTTRALAVDAATQHVGAVRARRAVVA